MAKLKVPTLTVFGVGALAVLAVLSAGPETTEYLARRTETSNAVAAKDAGASDSKQKRSREAYSQFPITFVENRGQTDQQVRYFAQGPHYAFFLTRNAVVFSLEKSHLNSVQGVQLPERSISGSPAFLINAGSTIKSARRPSSERIALGLQFLGANAGVIIDGELRAPGDVNYFRGSDPAAWRTGVPSFTQVVYHELWAGVDLRVHAKAGTLKYEFYVRPGARIEDIRMAYRGADRIALDSAGGLVIETGLGKMHDSAPVSFHEIGGVRTPVESQYVLEDGSTGEQAYSFRVGAGYRADQELIIDPGVEYSTFLGGTSNEVPTGVAVDAAGNAYVVGWTQSPDYPTTPGAFDRTGSASNNADVFVAKINPAGTALIYSTFIGGSNMDFGRAIAIDAAGNAYITGQTQSSNFPTTGNAFDRSLNFLNCPRCSIDATDAFVTKLNPTGSALVYSTYLGGATSTDDALSIAVDSAGSAYVAGETSSTDFPTTAAAFRRTNSGGDDAYVTKLNPSGSALVYSTFVGGSQEEFAARIEVDPANNAYVVGNTSSPDFPTTPGAFDTSPNGGFDAFVLKLNPAGSNLLYSTFLGGSDMDIAGGLAIDAAGEAYISGATLSLNYPTTPGVVQPVCTASGAFVTRLNATGTALIYSTCLAGGGSTAIAITPTGNAWITGSTSSQSFPTTPDAFQHFPAAGSVDAFITELNATGSAILYSTSLGGSDSDGGADLGLDLAGNVYVVGTTRSADFPTTPTAFDRIFKGRLDIFWGDAFITKLALNGTPPPPPALPTIAAVTTNLEVVGGNSIAVNVTLTSGAQGNGAVVALSSSNPAVLRLPASLTIPTGAQNGAAIATTWAVAANTPVTVTASYNNSSKGAVVTVLPPPPPAALSSIGFFPNIVTGGTAALAILAVTNPAPAGGFTATLSTNNPIAMVPATVTVPAGETNVSFSVPTATVTQSTGLTVFAAAGGRTVLAPLTVNPASPPVTTVALTVSATGRSGESIVSSPAGINVAVGNSTQAPFTSGTSITLTVTHGRDAIWSGACSSSGSKTKSCTFALNGAATVAANVQ